MYPNTCVKQSILGKCKYEFTIDCILKVYHVANTLHCKTFNISQVNDFSDDKCIYKSLLDLGIYKVKTTYCHAFK